MIDVQVTFRVTFDDEANAAYLYLIERIARGGVATTATVDHPSGMVNIDFDNEGRALGIEILEADAVLPAALVDRLRSS